MTQRFASLYPEGTEQLRVAPTFAVPRFPTADQIRNETDVRRFYGDRLLAEYQVEGSQDRIAVIDKLFPHARYDAMVLVSNNVMRSSVSDLSPAALGVVLELGRRFVAHVSDPAVIAKFRLDGGEIHICFNYDPNTIDRDNAMFYDKRFHLHLNCWPASDLAEITAIRLGEVTDSVVRRRLVDPVAALAARIICEAAGTDVGGFVLDPTNDVDSGEPIGLKVRLGGWGSLGEPAFHKMLQALHDSAHRAYRDIRSAFVGDPESAEPWTRPKLLAYGQIRDGLDDIAYLSSRSRAELLVLANELSDVGPDEMDRCRRDPALAVRRLSLNGLDYSIGFYTRQPISIAQPIIDAEDVTLLMQCRLFGDVGGAGLPPLRGTAAVRLDRKNGPVMDATDVTARTEFRAAYLSSHLNPLVQGGTLHPIEETSA